MSSLDDLTSELISVAEAARISGFTVAYIRRLIQQGKIEGVRIGHNWLTTRSAIQEYLSTERRPGPKPARE